MKIDIYREEHLIVLRISGRIEVSEIHNLESTFVKQIEYHPMTIGISLRDCTYMDSSALISFVRFMNIAEKSRIDLIWYDVNETVQKIFELAKVDKFLKIMTEKEFLDKFLI